MLKNFLRRLAWALLLFTGLLLFWSWAPDRPVTALVERWAPPPSQFFEMAGGLRVHLRDEGPADDPLPIVLLHGTSASLHTWDGWADGLKSSRRVIRFDLPGFGLTGPRADGDYRVETYARFVSALLDQLKVQRCILVGNSLGGEIAWLSALQDPARVARLVLIDASGYPLEARSIPLGWRIAATPGLSWLTRYLLPRSLVASSLRNTYGDPEKVSAELVERYYEITLREGNRAALSQRLQQYERGALAGRIAEVSVPTLILWGGLDQLIPPSQGERFEAQIRGSRRVLFPDLGHVPQEEDPVNTLAAARAFLDG